MGLGVGKGAALVQLGRLPVFLGLGAMAVASSALLARVRRDWAMCLDWPGQSFAFQDFLLAPGPLTLGALPFLPFALSLMLSARPALPARMLMAAGLVFLWLLWMLHDPGALHHCDRKGGSEGIVPVLGFLLALPLCWLCWPRRPAA